MRSDWRVKNKMIFPAGGYGAAGDISFKTLAVWF